MRKYFFVESDRMKTPILLVTTFLLTAVKFQPLAAQEKPSYLMRAYWDNDLFNVRGKGTDEAYTNGFRFDLFYLQRKSPRTFIGRVLPLAGDSSINIRGWGMGQMMMTPRDLQRTDYQPYDYSYAGALVGMHSLYSYNAKKRYAFLTDVSLGVRGPRSYTAQTQIFIHRLIGDELPRGWSNQLPGQLIANVSFTAEKQVLRSNTLTDLILGGQVSAGTLLTQTNLFINWRIGKLSPYFNGYISQHSSRRKVKGHDERFQVYLIVRPSTGITIDNDMLNEHPRLPSDANAGAVPSVQRWNFNLDCGVEVSIGSVGFSFIQKSLSPMLTGMPRHEVGNISFYCSW